MQVYCYFLPFSALVNIVHTELCPLGNLIIKRGLKPEEEQEATDAHNKFRERLVNGDVSGQPKAKFMSPLVYDLVLSLKANAISKQCASDPIPMRDRRWDSVGLNIYISYSSEFDLTVKWDTAVEAWANNCVGFKYPYTTTNTGLGYCRQLEWATSDTFGCAFIMFFNPDLNSDKEVVSMYICLYGNDANSPTNSNLPPYTLDDAN